MNNQTQMFPRPQGNNCQCSYEMRTLSNQINRINQEIRRLERRITNIEKNFIPTPYNKITPMPIDNNDFNYLNNYTDDNYMI